MLERCRHKAECVRDSLEVKSQSVYTSQSVKDSIGRGWWVTAEAEQ
jgi:hypothetical protein